MSEDFLWTEKYRPRDVKSCILPSALKQTFQTFVDQKMVPNLMLTGGAGCGKTTIARAMLEQLGCDYIMINGSLDADKDSLRTTIGQFASTYSMSGGRKYVILDEADHLTHHFQPALRNFMEEFSKNCGFILTCNFKNKIIEPLHSRCAIIDFNIPSDEKQKMAASFFARCQEILVGENIDFDKAALAEVIQKHFPDFRRVLNELQRYAACGKIDSGILVNFSEENYNELIKHLTDRDFKKMRKWVGQNSDIESHVLFRKLFDRSTATMTGSNIPALVVLLSRYQYQAAFAADAEINIVACLTEIMADDLYGD